jgi:2,3-dihydroxybiphenyl 1,2-dioxygenase
VGLGHVVFGVPDIDDAHAFVTDGLGMSQSDWLEMDAGGFTLNVRFYHCNARHHTVALGAVPFELPTKLHHVMLEANDVDDVGAAFDRVWNTSLPIANGLGKHPNDEMFSFYVVTPAGFQMEIGHGARMINEPWTGNRKYDRVSRWGHQPITR